jgi:hypothetical protein
MIDEARLIKKTGDYALAPVGGITDLVLMEVAKGYEARVTNKLTALLPDQLGAKFSGSDSVLVSEKYDGEGVFVYFEAERSPHPIFTFNSPSGRTRVGLSCLKALADKLRSKGVKKALFRAELYIGGKQDGRRRNASDVIRASFSTTVGDADALKLCLLDLVMLDGKDWQEKPLAETWDQLGQLMAGTQSGEHCHRAEGSIVPASSVSAEFDRITAGGGEGVVVRRTDRAEAFKVKPRVSLDAAVIGYVEGELESGATGLASLLVATMFPNGQLQVAARVGSGFNEEARKQWLALLQPLRKEPAPLTMTDSSGRLIHFVEPKIVVEIEAEDLMPDSTHSMQVFEWSNSSWAFKGMAKAPRLLFPIFKRRRDDKECTQHAVRAAQLNLDAGVPAITGADVHPPTILRREVYTKASKGETMVRKLVVLQRPAADAAFSHIIYWTDFSAGRKDPLKVSAQYADDPTRATALAEAAIAENITKGWEKVQ